MMSYPLALDGSALSIEDVEAVARGERPVELSQIAVGAIRASRGVLEAALADGEPHYGVNTGFGRLAQSRIPAERVRELQVNLIRSHAAGVGPPLERDVVRAMLLLLAASHCRGKSGVRVEVVERLAALLNAGVTPIVPETGSVGASGDLAPLAHIALVLIGEGEATAASGGRVLRGREALAAAGIEPLTLEAREGLALINGTHLMAGRAALLLADFDRVFDAALLAAAMSIDAARATDAFLDDRVHAARNQPGQREVASRLRMLLRGSQIMPSHRLNDPRVQDPYSLRCAPQVLGAVWDGSGYVKLAVERELGAVTDNPLVFDTSGAPKPGTPSIVSAGNFHGMPLAMPLDTLAVAVTHIAGIAERRVYHLLSGFDPEAGLPPFLSPDPGLHSGLMIAQYTAAACCNELITLSAPASVANISTSAGMEDYNSFGPRSAAKADRAVRLARTVVAIELLCAAAAIEHHRPLRSSPPIERAIGIIRGHVPALAADRPPSPDIEAIDRLLRSGQLRV